MHRYTIFSVAAVAFAIWMICMSRTSVDRDSTIIVLCAPSLAGPMEELKQAFNQSKANIGKLRVENTYRGSAELLAMYEISRIGDVLIAADVDYHNDFITAGFCNDAEPLAKQLPCLVFTSVSAKEALSVLEDETTEITTAVPKPKHAAIGRKVAAILGNARYDTLLRRAKVSRETVSQVTADVSSGIVDVGIAWSTSSQQFSNLNSVVPTQWSGHWSQIGVSVFRNSPRLQSAETFVDFLTSAEAEEIFTKYGFASGQQKGRAAGARLGASLIGPRQRADLRPVATAIPAPSAWESSGLRGVEHATAPSQGGAR